ncbi:MAG: SDR family oxidoreductase [Pseudomonadota bacterium]
MTTRLRLQDKIAIITGAASGIGRATALAFAAEGAGLALADWDEKGLAETAAAAGEAGARVITRKTDVSREDEVKDLVDLTMKTYARLDILVNNAGVVGSGSGLTDADRNDWQRVWGVNLMGAVLAIKYAAPIMMAQRSGAIVNTASVAGVRAGAGSNAYSASKAALINFTQTSACDLGEFGVRVNAVCPGLIETGMTKPIFDYARSKGKEEKLGGRCELRRYGRPGEVAAAILFLASDEAGYITGQALPVDGGNTASLNLPGMKF